MFTLVMVAVLVGLGLWQLQRRRREARADRGLDRAACSRAGDAAASLAVERARRPEHDEFRRVSFTATYQSRPDAMVYSSGSAVRDDVTGPGTWAFSPATLPTGEARRDQRRLRAEHDAGSRPAGSRGDAADHEASR